MLPAELHRVIADRWGLGVEAASRIAGNGEECEVWRVIVGRSLIVRLSPEWRTPQELAWAYDAARSLASLIPQVVGPVPALDGSVVVLSDRQPVSVWPEVVGVHADRDDESIRAQAAAILARLHRIAMGLPAPSRRPPSYRLPGSGPIDDDLGDADLTDSIRRWKARDAVNYPLGLVHGDFYRRNLLCRDGTIVGIIDWDDVRYDWLITELAWATWEFSKNPAGDRIVADRAASFLVSYRKAGGPDYPPQLIAPLIRQRLRDEICQSRDAATRDEPHDAKYEAGQLRAFTTVAADLRHVS